MEKLVLVTSVPCDFSMAENVDYDVSGVNNVAAPCDAKILQAGKDIINVSIYFLYDSDGNLVKEGPGYAPLIGLVRISNFKSVAVKQIMLKFLASLHPIDMLLML